MPKKKNTQNNQYFNSIWNQAERAAWRLPAKITVSQWADKYRILDSKTCAEPGQWRTIRTPYLREIMDSFTNPHVEEITIMASTQIGKTESIYNMIGYIIDEDPGPVMLVMPREPDAKNVSYNRVRPMIELSPTLRSHMPANQDDMAKLEYNLDRMILYFEGSNSPAALSQKPIRYLLFDEVDKYPKFSGREADPIKLATERTRTFKWNKKIVKSSTPTTKQGYIYREYEKSSRERYFVPCPYCGVYQILIFGQIKWPEGEGDPGKIKNHRLAWYECEACNKKISDKHKAKMLERGVWAPEDAEIDSNGKIDIDKNAFRHRGFWISAIYSPWLTFSDIAAEFLNSKDYIELLMNFINSWLAEVWEEKLEETKPALLRQLILPYEEGVLPAGVLVLTAGVDVQKDHFYIIIRGWGYGEESWQIRACRVESWEEVISTCFKTQYAYKGSQPGSAGLEVRLTNMDSAYRTNEVYEVARTYRDRARATKGRDHLYGGMMYQISHIDRDSRGRKIPGGLGLWHLDTSYYKDKLNRFMHAQPGDPAQWHLFSEPSDEYFKQVCAEQKVQRRDKKSGRVYDEWRLVSAGAKNHFLDCEVGAVAAADMLRVSALRPENETTTYTPRKRGGFINRPEGKWISRKLGGWVRRGQ